MSNVLDEFLVLLGWKVDEAGARKAETTAKRVSDSVVEGEKRATEASVAGTAKRKIEADREAGVRTKGAAELIEAEKKRKAALDRTAKEDEKRRKDRAAAEAKATKESEASRQSFMTGVAAMSAAASAAAVSVVAAIVKISTNLEHLYYASQRTKASASNLSAFGFAASQLGAQAEAAVGSVEALARKMRESPGYESMLSGLGVQTRESNGAWRDRVKVFTDLGDVLRKMPDHQAIAYGDALGIDRNTLDAIRSGEMLKYMARYREMLGKAGLDEDKAAKSSKRFMDTWRDLWGAVGIITTKVQSSLVDRFGGSVEKFTDLLLRNADRIADVAVKIGQFFGRLLDGTDRLIQGFNNLDPSTKHFLAWGAGIGAVLIFLGASPLAAMLSFAAGVVTLYEDYLLWKDGSKDTLIDWDKWGPPIEKALSALKSLWEGFDRVTQALAGQDGLTVAFAAFAGVLALKVLAPLGKVVGLLGTLGSLTPPLWLLKMLGIGAVAGVIASDVLKNSTPEGRAGTISDAEAMINREQGGASGYQRGWVGRGWDATKRMFGFGGGEDAAGHNHDHSGGGTNTSREIREGGSRSWRNNNPGNLKFSDATKKMGATGADDKGFAVFPSYETGRSAMEGLLFSDPRYKDKTISGAISQYAPASDNNDTPKYIATVAKAAGVSADTPLASMSADQRKAMLDTMQAHEGWEVGRQRDGIKGTANLMRGQEPYGAPGENLTTITTASGRKLTVHKEAAEAFKGFIGELEATGYKIDSLGGHAHRTQANGSGRMSQHAYGNAIDINPSKNPYKTSITDMPKNVSDMAAKWGLSWGGDWSERFRDPMHFEWTGKRPWLDKKNGPQEVTLPEQAVSAGAKKGAPSWSDVAIEGLKRLGDTAAKAGTRLDHAFDGFETMPEMASRLSGGVHQLERFNSSSLGTDPSQVNNSAKNVTFGDTNIKVEGVKDPHEAAKHTDTTLKRHRSDLIGNLGTALA